MKKLRFIGLLAVVLLAFAFVVSCGDAGGGPGTPPVVPPGTDSPQYPAYQGGTGASGLPIKPPDPPDPPGPEDVAGIELNLTSKSLKVGEEILLEAKLLPEGTAVLPEGGRLLWASATGAVASVSQNGRVTAIADAGSGAPGTSNITVTPQRLKDDGTFENIPDITAATCVITVYEYSSSMSDTNMAKLSWEALIEFQDDEDVNLADLKTAVTTIITGFDTQENKAGMDEFLSPAAKAMLPGTTLKWKGTTSTVNGTASTKAFTYYAVLGGATEYLLNLPPGWRVASGSSNPIPFSSGQEAYAKLEYPIAGQTAPFIWIRVCAIAEITFKVPATTKTALDTDGFIATAATTPVLQLIDMVDGSASTGGFVFNTNSGYKVLSGSTTLSGVAMITARLPAAKIGVYTLLQESSAPKKYAYDGIPAAASTTTTGNGYTQYTFAGGLESKKYEITLARVPVDITAVANVTGFTAVKQGATLTTVTPTVGTTPASAATVAAATWHSDAAGTSTAIPTASGDKVYAKFVLTPVAGYSFKTGFGPSDIAVADAVKDDVAVVSAVPTPNATNGSYTVIVSVVVNPVTIGEAEVAIATLPSVTGGSAVKPSILATFTCKDDTTGTAVVITGLKTPVQIDWQVKATAAGTAAPWDGSDPADGNVFIATVVLEPASGFKWFAFADDAATKAKVTLATALSAAASGYTAKLADGKVTVEITFTISTT